MRLRKRILWPAITVVVVAVAIGAAVSWNRRHQAPPQIITLSNGDQYRFVGATYSTKNVPPVFAARLQRLLPKSVANWSRKYLRTDTSQFNQGETLDSPRLFVWFQRLGTNTPFSVTNLTARLADESGVEGGASTYPAFARSVAWTYAEFEVIPRRSRTLQCTLYPFAVTPNAPNPVGQVTFANPAYGHFPQWQPEPMPTVRKDSDLEVRLDDLTTGHQANPATILKPNGSWGLPIRKALRGQEALTSFDMSIISPPRSNEFWVLHSVKMSDATGNAIRDGWFGQDIFGYNEFGPRPTPLPPKRAYSESIQGTLWPDENAWRLKLEFKRALGFTSNELVTFPNVPIPKMGATNNLHIVKTAGGCQIVLTQFVRKPDMIETIGGMPDNFMSRVRFEFPDRPAGVAFDIQNMTTDQGKPERYGWSSPDSGYLFLIKSIPSNAQTMDLTWVVQRTRTVEFMVKPPKPD